MLVNVEALVVIAALVIIELVIDTVRLILDIAILQVGKHIPLLIDMIGRLHECVRIKLRGIRVIVLMIAVHQIFLSHEIVGSVCHESEVVAAKLLLCGTGDNIPSLVFVVGIQHRAVAMLRQAFFSHEVGLLDILAVGICCHQPELREFIIGTELLVVTESVGIVQRGRGGPTVAELKCRREDVVVLPEVIGRFVPEIRGER